jgi:acyl carrier protein
MSAWLLQQKAKSLSLVSRSGEFSSNAFAALAAPAFNAMVALSKCDASFQEDVGGVLTGNSRMLTGLLHAGGVLADATVANQTAGGIAAVFAPKEAAFTNAQTLLKIHPMQSSVLFSSVAALLGSVGQLNYSIANSWLDAAARIQQTFGHSVLSVQFGAWKGAGMAAASAAKMESMGLGALTPDSGLASLAGFLRAAAGQPAGCQSLPASVAMSPVDWKSFLKNVEQPVPAYFGAFAHLKEDAELASSAAKRPAAAAASMAATAGMDAAQRSQYLLQEVGSAAVSIIGGSISDNDPLLAAGLDSLGAVELRNSLESRLGLELPSTLAFDYPTVTAIAAFIDSTTAGAAAASSPELTLPETTAVVSAAANSSLALLGMATRSPADTLSQDTAQDVVSMLPLSRWDAELQLTQDMPVRFGAFVSGAFLFDAAAFATTGTEAVLMDPQQRLLLECTEEALVAAGPMNHAAGETTVYIATKMSSCLCWLVLFLCLSFKSFVTLPPLFYLLL